jgi:hypothetical protein
MRNPLKLRPVSCLSTLDCLIPFFRSSVFCVGFTDAASRGQFSSFSRKGLPGERIFRYVKSSTKLCLVGQGRRRGQGASASRRGEDKRRADPGITRLPVLAFSGHILLHDHYDEPRSGVSICLVNALAQQSRLEYCRTVPNSRHRVPVPRLQNE